MPISNGQDRNNYSTTINFSNPAKRRSESVLKIEPKMNMSRAGSFRQQGNRVLDSQETPRAPLDPAFVYIPDQRLREIIQKLVTSEQDRLVNNIDPNLITQINHRGYSLFFSRTGNSPFEQNQNSSQVQAEKHDKQQNMPQKASEENYDTIAEEVIPHQKFEKARIPSSSTQTNEPVNLINTERTPNVMVRHSPEINNEIPPEANRIIQQDLAQNPLVSGERTYRIVLNKSNSRQGEEPKVMRVIVRSQSVPRLPQIQPKYVIQQQKSQIFQYHEQPNVNKQNTYYENERSASLNKSASQNNNNK